MSFNIDSDADKVARDLKQMADKVDPALRKSAQESAQAVARYGAKNAPVDTGRMRNSIHVTQDGPLMYNAGPTVSYSRFVHDGTRYMRARPFMEQGAQQAQGTIDRSLEQAADKVIR